MSAGMNRFQAAPSRSAVWLRGCRSWHKGGRLSSSTPPSGCVPRHIMSHNAPFSQGLFRLHLCQGSKANTDSACVFTQPEAISGSSRMKGGSATKIVLEVVLSAAHAAAFSHTPVANEYVRWQRREAVWRFVLPWSEDTTFTSRSNFYLTQFDSKRTSDWRKSEQRLD